MLYQAPGVTSPAPTGQTTVRIASIVATKRQEMATQHVIAVDTANEPHAIRAAAEWWGYTVTVTWVGNVGQVVDFLSQRPPHDIIVLSAHGDARGMCLPTLAEEIAGNYPYREVIRPNDFREFLRLDGNEVVNLSCVGGTADLAEAFLNGGCGCYMGAVDYPEGNASLMYALEYLYNRVSGLPAHEAHRLASQHDDDRGQFRFFARGYASL